MKASDLFVRSLEETGITHIFGVPGEENADFILSLEETSRAIRFILTRHEQGAAFMAEVYGRLLGRPAGCLGTLGPGASNLLTGVADANMDRAPILALTGQGGTQRLHKESHQIMDVITMFSPVTKWAATIANADAIPEMVVKAVRLACEEKPGATLLELPEDIAHSETDARVLTYRQPRRPAPDDKALDKAWTRICAARKPIIIAGNGAIRRRAHRQLTRFCDATGIGVMSTFMGKGAVSMDKPYCLYSIGLGQRDLVSLAVDDADLVITVGYDMVEYPPSLWNPKGDKAIVHLDFLAAETDANYNPAVEAIGDLAHAIWGLNERRERDGITADAFDLSNQRDIRKRMGEELAAHKDDTGPGPVRPQKILWDVRETLGANDILISGVGAHKMWIARHYHCLEPNTCIIPNGFCSMGLALPGAIGAHIAMPERKILAIAGDGDFMMNVQEMETARRLNANITVMVWEDHAYGLIAWKQQARFGRHTKLSFLNPDWMELASAFGWHGSKVEDASALKPTLEAALAHEGPSLVLVPVDYRENAKLSKRLGEISMQM